MCKALYISKIYKFTISTSNQFLNDKLPFEVYLAYGQILI